VNINITGNGLADGPVHIDKGPLDFMFGFIDLILKGFDKRPVGIRLHRGFDHEDIITQIFWGTRKK